MDGGEARGGEWAEREDPQAAERERGGGEADAAIPASGAVSNGEIVPEVGTWGGGGAGRC